MKVIRGEGLRGLLLVKPKRMEDAVRATRLEHFLNHGAQARLWNELVYGTADPTPEMRLRYGFPRGGRR